MQTTSVNETTWDLIAEANMFVRFDFYSDTNLSQARDELEILELETLAQEGSSLVVSGSEFAALEEPIMSVIDAWGGSLTY